MTVYQQRLVVTIGNYILWTDPLGVTFPAANYLELDLGNRDLGSIPALLVPHSPSLLMVATTAGTWASVEGDLDDPIVRTMGESHYVTGGSVGSNFSDDDGIWFVSPGGGIWQAQNQGSSFTRMDIPLVPLTAEPRSNGLLRSNQYVFTPLGFIYDKETGAWFKDSYANTNTVYDYIGNSQGAVWYVESKAGFDVRQLATIENSSTRATTYTVKTAPLRAANGHQVNLREVQVMVKSQNAAATVAVTVDGTTVTSAALGTGTNVVIFPFNKRGEYLDVQIVPNSNTTDEAPIIEAIRIGTRPDGHRLR
jgi:hypothetical protein